MVFTKQRSLFFLIMLVASQQTLSAQLEHEQQQTIEKYQDDAYLDSLVEKAEEISQKYANDEYINNLVNADQIRLEKLHAFNNRLLYSLPLPLPNNMQIGIYTKDVIKLGFLGVELSVDVLLQKQFEEYLISYFFNRLTTTTDATTSTQGVCLQELLQSSFALTLATACLTTHLAQALKNTVLAESQAHNKSWVNVVFGPSPAQHDNKAIPIFSFIEEHILMHLALKNPKASMLATINEQFLAWGLLPSFYTNGYINCVQDLAFLVLFFGWFNKYFLTPMWTHHVTHHQEQLSTLLAKYQAVRNQRLYTGGCQVTQTDSRLGFQEESNLLEAQIKALIADGVHLSFLTWLKIKNTKLAEWKMYGNAIMSLPAWYKLTIGAYKLYQQITQEPATIATKTEEQPSC